MDFGGWLRKALAWRRGRWSGRYRLHAVAAVLAISLVVHESSAAGPPGPVYAFVNGRWWNGTQFVNRPMYTTEGSLSSQRPGRIDESIDLGGRYVVPPIAEGHNHWLEPTQFDAYNRCYLADGVFYVRDMANTPWVVNQLRDRVNLSNSVDFISALQGFSAPRAHPIEVLDYFTKVGILPKTWKPPYDPEAMFAVTTAEELQSRFELLLKENPAFVKAFLSYSEEYDRRKDDPSMYGNHRGMDPRLLPRLAQLTHAAGLKLHVHIYTAADFRTAVRAGADEIAHLPGAAPEINYPSELYRLTAADAALARKSHVTVTTTIHDVIGLEADEDQARRKELRDKVIIPNLQLLRSHQVPILLGSDHFRHSPLDELMALNSLGVFTARELMRIATVDTPRDIFPTRRIGTLNDASEANFLVLDRDPTADIQNLRSIWLRVKGGRRIDLPQAAIKRPTSACIED